MEEEEDGMGELISSGIPERRGEGLIVEEEDDDAEEGEMLSVVEDDCSSAIASTGGKSGEVAEDTIAERLLAECLECSEDDEEDDEVNDDVETGLINGVQMVRAGGGFGYGVMAKAD